MKAEDPVSRSPVRCKGSGYGQSSSVNITELRPRAARPASVRWYRRSVEHQRKDHQRWISRLRRILRRPKRCKPGTSYARSSRSDLVLDKLWSFRLGRRIHMHLRPDPLPTMARRISSSGAYIVFNGSASGRRRIITARRSAESAFRDDREARNRRRMR